MELDKITYDDLSIFNNIEEASIFNTIDFTRTLGGKDRLLQLFYNPYSDLKRISETQDIISLFIANESGWPSSISNGTIMVMERFYETAIDELPSQSPVQAMAYKIFHSSDFSLVRYSVQHFADFLRGMNQLITLFDKDGTPSLLRTKLQKANSYMQHPTILEMAESKAGKGLSVVKVIEYGSYLRKHFKQLALELIDVYGYLDAWYSMAQATVKHKLTTPVFVDSAQPFIDVTALYHILLPHPVSYDLQMNRDNNFIFLTGANMAGKSTFIRAVGSAVFLAHLGMGVPASAMRLTLFDGILSNINVVDNIIKGESYFFNEVQRVKNTIIKINDGRKWLVLIDELFKGTNVQDAMQCSVAVIKGLIKIKSSLFILSTHLYEIGEELKPFSNIAFRYFETAVSNEQLTFSYQLKQGISNDRFGYLILKREKVVDMLDSL